MRKPAGNLASLKKHVPISNNFFVPNSISELSKDQQKPPSHRQNSGVIGDNNNQYNNFLNYD